MNPIQFAAQGQQAEGETGILSNEVGSELRNQFMTLMLAEIENQDPTDPTDSIEYVTQLAQFSQVESLENIREQQASGQVLMENANIVQSASLIGKQALVPSDQFVVDGHTQLQGKAYLEAAAESATLEISNASGVVVASQELGAQGAGELNFNLDSQALNLSQGEYSLRLKTAQGDATQLPQLYLNGEIERVHFASAAGVMMAEMGGGLGTVSVLSISEVANGGAAARHQASI